MFRDKLWRVVCRVGVAYGSNIDLVTQTLLDVAAKHSSVHHNSPNQPTVLFREFGENSLIFELWCIIDNVNHKHIITSELNYAIDRAFRKNGITIAFPQRDIYIKNSQSITGN